MTPASFAWGWLKDQTATAFDKYVGKRRNIYLNLVLFAMFAPVAFFLEHGWVRDLWWCVAGIQLGYAFMWLTFPRFSKARAKETEAEITQIIAGTMYRMTRECFGQMTRIEAEELDKRTLQ